MNSLFAPDLGEAVPLGEIESRLRAFWARNESSQKASLINLVVWSEAEDALERLPATIQAVSEENACRALLIHADLDPALEPQTRAWITAHCRLLEHGKQACSEQIAFDFRGRITGRARNALMAHLLADLPVVLYWEGEISELFQPDLLRQVDRLVVDSALWSEPQQTWQLLEARRASLQDMTLHDLAWTRSYAMRLLLASRMDDPRLLAQLAEAQSLKIRYAQGQRATALSILGWIATIQELSLSSRQRAPSGEELELTGPLTLQAQLEESSKTAAPIEHLEWRIGASKIHFQAEHQHGQVSTAHASCMPQTQVIPLEIQDVSALIHSQLGRGGRNQLFERCLPKIRELS